VSIAEERNIGPKGVAPPADALTDHHPAKKSPRLEIFVPRKIVQAQAEACVIRSSDVLAS
jgi:hypothetical protein